MNSPNKDIKPKLVGGLGEKKSNGGTQWYQHDRVYDSRTISMCLLASLPGGGYWYLVEENNKK